MIKKIPEQKSELQNIEEESLTNNSVRFFYSEILVFNHPIIEG